MTMATAKKTHEAAVEETPTPAQARDMFATNPGLSFIVTTDGGLHRDGRLEPLPAVDAE